MVRLELSSDSNPGFFYAKKESVRIPPGPENPKADPQTMITDFRNAATLADSYCVRHELMYNVLIPAFGHCRDCMDEMSKPLLERKNYERDPEYKPRTIAQVEADIRNSTPKELK